MVLAAAGMVIIVFVYLEIMMHAIKCHHISSCSILAIGIICLLLTNQTLAADEKQSPPTPEVAAPELQQVVEEARQALREISAAITTRDFKELEGRLLDNGRLLAFKSVSSERLEEGLRVEVEILKKLDLDTSPQDIRFERTSEYQVDLSAEKKGIEKAEKRETESIVWTIPGTAELVKEFIPHPHYHPDSTFDRNGNLKV